MKQIFIFRVLLTKSEGTFEIKFLIFSLRVAPEECIFVRSRIGTKVAQFFYYISQQSSCQDIVHWNRMNAVNKLETATFTTNFPFFVRFFRSNWKWTKQKQEKNLVLSLDQDSLGFFELNTASTSSIDHSQSLNHWMLG